MADGETTTPGWSPGPLRPAVAAGELHVWRLDLDAAPAAAEEVLSAAERERRQRLVTEELRRRWGNSRRGLREVLGRYLGQPAATVELASGDAGKPELAAEPAPLRFNLSHSGGLALVAVSAALPVGVDLERVEPRRRLLALAQRQLAPGAAEAVRAAPPERRAEVFYAAWTEYEARAKCQGGGIAGGPGGETVTSAPLDAGPGYAAAVAVAASAVPPPRRFLLG